VNKLPTSAEIEILNILWERESCSVREVHQIINAKKPIAYTTTLKLMQIMAEKGLAARNEKARAHIYSPIALKEEIRKAIVSDILDRIFQGSSAEFISQILEIKKLKSKAQDTLVKSLTEPRKKKKKKDKKENGKKSKNDQKIEQAFAFIKKKEQSK
jgi:BlaI family transcriptional regulator, penicillinase repressor